MTTIIQLREEVDGDLQDAASWYEKQQTGLGHKFLDEAFSAFRLIEKQPNLYPIVHRNTRRTLMRRFSLQDLLPHRKLIYCDLSSYAWKSASA